MVAMKSQEMPKVKKQNKANKKNAQKAGRPKSRKQQQEVQDLSDNYDSDEDFFCGTQPRPVDNSSSCFFFSLLMLQTMLDTATSCDGQSPKYTLDIASYKGTRCNLSMICRCGIAKTIWTTPENFDEALLLGCKLSGIQQGQLQDLLTSLNFGHKNDKEKTYTVNIYGPRLRKLSQELDIKLDEMKKEDEANIFKQILASSSTELVHLSTDGMYPIRNNSGICVSSVMGSINGVKKIICKSKIGIFKKPSFSKNRFYQHRLFQHLQY